MKKLVATFLLAIGVLTTSFAQRGEKRDFEKFTPEQKSELHLKRMTLNLDLTPNQISQIRLLLLEQSKEQKVMHEKRKAMKESGKKLSTNERFEMENNILDKQIAFKAEMKRILDAKQYEKFEKFAHRKMHKMKRKKEKRNGRKEHKRKNK